MSKLDDEKKLIRDVFNNAIECLSEEDRNLPQIAEFLPLIEKGIGIHHSGLLPIVKESVEILFAEGLISVLFATETFAMGLNMPARSVIFTKCIKFDGVQRRYIKGNEFIQMSGRAGRRGLDPCGFVIIMCDEKISQSSLKNMIMGQSDALNSAFYLSYTMVLNLLRVDGINPESMMERSFRQFQCQSTLPKLVSQIKEHKDNFESMKIDDEQCLLVYYKLQKRIDQLENEIKNISIQPVNIMKFLNPGRIILIRTKKLDFGPSIVISYVLKNSQKGEMTKEITKEMLEQIDIDRLMVNVLLSVNKNSAGTSNLEDLRPSSLKDQSVAKVVQVNAKVIFKLTSVVINIPAILQSDISKKEAHESLLSTVAKFGTNIPILDPIDQMKCTDAILPSLLNELNEVSQSLKNQEIQNKPNFKENYEILVKKVSLGEEIEELSKEAAEKQSLLLENELKCRKEVLKNLEFIDNNDVVQLKGRVACEISCGNALILTELLLDKFFDDLSVEEISALLSCFVFQEKGDPYEDLPENLIVPYNRVKLEARKICRISNECGLEIDEEKYLKSLSPGAAAAVFMWAQGRSFYDVCASSTNFEGSIIRCMRRMQELIQEMSAAANVIGNTELSEKFLKAAEGIRRDIVFAASLYL